MIDNFQKEITVGYTNYRDEYKIYRIIPKAIKFEKTKYHDEQWILYAFDVERNVSRGFALIDIDFSATPYDTFGRD